MVLARPQRTETDGARNRTGDHREPAKGCWRLGDLHSEGGVGVTVRDMIKQLRDIELAAEMGIVRGVMVALIAGMLAQELEDTETEADAMERAQEFIAHLIAEVG